VPDPGGWFLGTTPGWESLRTRKKIKRAAEVAVAEGLMLAARATPRRAGQALFARAGSLAARMFVRDRRRAVENLGVAFPEAPEPFRRALAASMFKTLGRNAYEFLRLENASRESLLRRVERIEGMEHFLAAHREGRGVIVITGHIGCWEVMPAHFVALGYRVSVIARRMRVERLNTRLVAVRKSVGVDTIDRDDNPRRMLEPLRRGEILGVLIDQHTRVAGMWVPFFGRPAYTPTAVAKMALASGAAIVPMGIFLARNGRHVIRVLPAIPAGRPARAERERMVREITEACSLAVENLIRTDPKQWVWFHHRWREPDKTHEGAEAAYAVEG
jgi:Kdo2-lipid IVA lauroyltransferase/acyltransferase